MNILLFLFRETLPLNCTVGTKLLDRGVFHLELIRHVGSVCKQHNHLTVRVELARASAEADVGRRLHTALERVNRETTVLGSVSGLLLNLGTASAACRQ